MDMSGYNVAEMADDVVEIANALGYEKIQLKGSSFGSFWALAIIREYPERIARATLADLEGPDHTFDRPSDVKHALQLIAASAEKSERYKNRIPAAGLVQAYQEVIKRADENPVKTSFIDEQTQKEIHIEIDGDGFRKLAVGVRRPPLYYYLAQNWPEDLLAIIEGDYQAAARRLHRVWTWRGQDHAVETLIECSSGFSAQRRIELENDPAVDLLGAPDLFDDGICGVWADDVRPMDTSSFSTTVPVVLIHGNWDISTPYENTVAVRGIFQDHHFIHVERGFHGAGSEAEENNSEFIEQMNHWYATGERTALPSEFKLPQMKWTGEI